MKNLQRFLSIVLIICLVGLGISLYEIYQQNIINLGTAANDGTGDSLRAAFTKVNKMLGRLTATVISLMFTIGALWISKALHGE